MLFSRFLLLGLMCVVYGASVQALPGPCPCLDRSLCQPVKEPPRKEIFVFRTSSNDNWKKYDWSTITTITDFGKYDTELLCYAHSMGVRYVIAGGVGVATLGNATARALWVKSQLDKTTSQFMDGINFDFEAQISEDQASGLVALVNETSLAFKEVNPYYQISFDTPFAPGCTWGRCYDYKSLSEVCDFLVVMNYDINGGLFATANDPFRSYVIGIESFIADLIPPSKLVVAFPWYGYDWPCSHLLSNNICSFIGVDMKPVNRFSHGVVGSENGMQRCYSDITQMMKNMSISDGTYNATYVSKFFTYKDVPTGKFHQVWYDDPSTLGPRYQYAKDHNLLGVGMWEADCLDYGTDPEGERLTKEMWDAISEFVK